jgi:hypothetical protein
MKTVSPRGAWLIFSLFAVFPSFFFFFDVVIPITSTIVDADEENGVIGWRGVAFGTRAVHTWKLEETRNGVRVDTEESFEG